MSFAFSSQLAAGFFNLSGFSLLLTHLQGILTEAHDSVNTSLHARLLGRRVVQFRTIFCFVKAFLLWKRTTSVPGFRFLRRPCLSYCWRQFLLRRGTTVVLLSISGKARCIGGAG